MQNKINEISDLLNDVYCLINCIKDSCEHQKYITQAVNLTYAIKIIDKIRNKLDLLED